MRAGHKAEHLCPPRGGPLVVCILAILRRTAEQQMLCLVCQESSCGRGQWEPPITPVDALIAATKRTASNGAVFAYCVTEFGRLFASWLIQVDDRFTQWRSHG
jgi:hypothetical protein